MFGVTPGRWLLITLKHAIHNGVEHPRHCATPIGGPGADAKAFCSTPFIHLALTNRWCCHRTTQTEPQFRRASAKDDGHAGHGWLRRHFPASRVDVGTTCGSAVGCVAAGSGRQPGPHGVARRAAGHAVVAAAKAQGRLRTRRRSSWTRSGARCSTTHRSTAMGEALQLSCHAQQSPVAAGRPAPFSAVACTLDADQNAGFTRKHSHTCTLTPCSLSQLLV